MLTVALGGALWSAFAWFGHVATERGRAEEHSRTVQAEIALALAQNAVDRQAQSLKGFADAAIVQAQVSARSAEALESLAASMRTVENAAAALKQKDAGNHECEALLATDLSTVCPGHVASLRLYEHTLSSPAH